MPSTQQILAQSKSAYNQWCVQWREQAKIHSSFKMKSFDEFANIGIGKACLLVANGYSLEENISTIKEKQHNVDILCCDKTLGSLLNNGITPTYVMVCDANVNFEKYCEAYKDKLENTILFINVCANPKWSQIPKWKDIFFFANEDILKSEIEFMQLSSCPNKIPAATNVSNAMVVLMCQSDNSGRRNFFGYDKYLLVGFDYSWAPNKKYYSFNEDGDGKNNYMRHHYILDLGGDACYTSNNLLFSAQWLEKYIRTFNLPIIQCTTHSILNVGRQGDLSKEMDYSFKRYHYEVVLRELKKRNDLIKQLSEVESKLNKISKEHYLAAFN